MGWFSNFLLVLSASLCVALDTEVKNYRLLNAINANDGKELEKVLLDTSRKQLNKRGNGGQTPLMFAALSGKENAIQLLLEAGMARATTHPLRSATRECFLIAMHTF